MRGDIWASLAFGLGASLLAIHWTNRKKAQQVEKARQARAMREKNQILAPPQSIATFSVSEGVYLVTGAAMGIGEVSRGQTFCAPNYMYCAGHRQASGLARCRRPSPV